MTYQKYHVDYRKDDLIDMYLHITLRLPGCDVSRSLCNNEKKRTAAGKQAGRAKEGKAL
jgi:hypothetical protein